MFGRLNNCLLYPANICPNPGILIAGILILNFVFNQLMKRFSMDVTLLIALLKPLDNPLVTPLAILFHFAVVNHGATWLFTKFLTVFFMLLHHVLNVDTLSLNHVKTFCHFVLTPSNTTSLTNVLTRLIMLLHHVLNVDKLLLNQFKVFCQPCLIPSQATWKLFLILPFSPLINFVTSGNFSAHAL